VLAIGQMSNVTGGCPDLRLAIDFAHQAGMIAPSGSLTTRAPVCSATISHGTRLAWCSASLTIISSPGCRRVLAIGQMSNVTGGCPDLRLAIDFAHQAGMIVMVDGAQGAVHFPADVQALDIDFYAFSAHKLRWASRLQAARGRAGV
jgi:selenocysteine lyase/cysteine desulfurase